MVLFISDEASIHKALWFVYLKVQSSSFIFFIITLRYCYGKRNPVAVFDVSYRQLPRVTLQRGALKKPLENITFLP